MAIDDEYAQLQDALVENPEQGKVIPGTGGLRKMRWAESARGKGKRGGLRIIYLHIEKAGRIYMITLYSKDQSDDLSPDDKRLFKALTDSIHNELKGR